MIVEPNCELPWDLYLDWLADQGFDDLREVSVCSLIYGDSGSFSYHNYHNSNGIGIGCFHAGCGHLSAELQIRGDSDTVLYAVDEGIAGEGAGNKWEF